MSKQAGFISLGANQKSFFEDPELVECYSRLYGKLPTKFLLVTLFRVTQEQAQAIWDQLLEEELESAMVEQVAKELKGEEGGEEDDEGKAATPAD